jgi:class 3 adenylate cyclase
VDNVAHLLQQLDLVQYASVFAENGIDEEVLLELTDADLEKLGVALGHRKKLLKAIASLCAGEPISTAPRTPATQRSIPAPEQSEPERRQLTVMFCDLVGSTRLSL